MNEQDILSAFKEQVREELDREADKTIEELVNEFRYKLVQNKTLLIAEMLNGIDILLHQNEIKQDITFQINIKAKGGAD